MPSYEPKPRRFSTISVSRTSSRRNSIDDISRPSLAVSDVPVFPSLTSPFDLAGASKHFMETVDAEGEAERGRSRQSAGHRRSVTAWSHDLPVEIKVPSAKRDTSASTRERIAMWEERSRSQSKGRSKSRGRDLGPGTRISVVPEMPELPTALSGLGRPEKVEEGESSTIDQEEARGVSDTLQRLDGIGLGDVPILDDPATPKPENPEAVLEDAPRNSIYESLNDKDHAIWSDDHQLIANSHIPGEIDIDKENWGSQQFRDDIQTWAGQVTHSPPQSPQEDPNSDRNKDKEASDDERPHTPIVTTRALLPTPDATPRKIYSRGSNQGIARENIHVTLEVSEMSASSLSGVVGAIEEVHDNKDDIVADVVDNTPERPSTPVRKIVDLPLTPDATPIQIQKSTRDDVDSVQDNTADQPVGPRGKPTIDFLPGTEQHRPTNQVTPLHESQPQRKLAESPLIMEDSHLSSEMSPNVETNETKPESEEIEAPPKLPPRPTPSTEKSDQTEARYHEVWKITDYAPEFPVPARPTVQATLEHATAPFDGNPLQEPPKTQLSAAAAAYRPPPESITPAPASRTVEYPHPTCGRAGEGDWTVDIPPSPTSAYHRVADDHRPARPPKPRSRSRSRGGRNGGRGGARITSRGGDPVVGERHEWDAPPVFERAFHAASVSIFQGLTVPMGLYRGFRDIYYPPPERPDIIKAYPIRRRLPVRIFFPSHYDLTSPALLPTLFTLHGGGFTVGYASDDDMWNRSFADTYTILVIALNYSKAPWAAFPAPLHDAEALYHAVLNDESLPIDRMRTALCGFDAGANLALALAQLPSVKSGRDPSPLPPVVTSPGGRHANRHRSMYFSTGGPPPEGYQPNIHRTPSSTSHGRSHPPPRAIIPICGILDFTTAPSVKARTRPYKRSLRGPRGWGPGLDWMARLLPSSAWSYIPYGHDTSDPLLSPVYASRKDLPPYVFVIAAELDCLAHESWRAACTWARGGNQAVPDGDIMVGRRVVSRWRGCLDDGEGLDGGKFGWVHGEEEGSGSTRWLLVPDVVHGFDSAPWRNKYLWGDEEARMDAEMKTIAYQKEMAEWLWGTVWK